MHGSERLEGLCGAQAQPSKKNGKLRGRAVSYYIEFGGIFNDRMDLRFDPAGTLTILGGTHSHGQGHATVFAQLAHEWLGVPLEPIRYVQGDTAQVPIGRGTYGARSAMVGGNALKAASDAMIEKAKPMAATLMEADAADLEFKDGSSASSAPTRRSASSMSPRPPMRRWVRCTDNSASGWRRPAASAPIRRAIRTARMCASSRSIRKPARWRSTAISWSTISAA